MNYTEMLDRRGTIGVTLLRDLGREPAREVAKPAGEARANAYPEETVYTDDGCILYGSCLSCPYARCVYEQPGGMAGYLRELRDELIVGLVENGETMQTIARKVGVSLRTVARAKEKRR